MCCTGFVTCIPVRIEFRRNLLLARQQTFSIAQNFLRVCRTWHTLTQLSTQSINSDLSLYKEELKQLKFKVSSLYSFRALPALLFQSLFRSDYLWAPFLYSAKTLFPPHNLTDGSIQLWLDKDCKVKLSVVRVWKITSMCIGN